MKTRSVSENGGGLSIVTDDGNGTVFRLAPGAKGEWTFAVLYRFTGGSDGEGPVAGVVLDAAGNLYGTTTAGGDYGGGTVFELIPGNDGEWTEKVLHSFGNGKDGEYPHAVILDAAGNLYGTTCCGGPYGSSCSPNGYGCGIAFELSPVANGKWKEKVLHNFNHNGKDGYNSAAGLIFDVVGNLYGTAQWGGARPKSCTIVDGCGIVFELSPSANGRWTEKVLHSFVDNGKDGAYPDGEVVFDSSGSLYGTTIFGGAYGSNCNCGGTVFKLAPGNDGKWTERVVHSFGNGKDGEFPQDSLILDAAGNLYGVTSAGGSLGTGRSFYGQYGDDGTVFEITP